ncbi:unconventional myosin-IXb-like isoform X1 [Clytia hemisphaerica]|uniref:unconventional myosin-IXb-like isoform X1 n=1 Tax=Clytia hemisphaerica TaxID=252671 RepID=UPI0034D57D27
MPGMEATIKEPTSPLPVLYPITVYTTILTPDGKVKTEVNVTIKTTVSDAIQTVLDSFSIVSSVELFDLCEVYSEFGVFPTDPDAVFENLRSLSYSEYPLAVQKAWTAGAPNGLDRSNMSEDELSEKSPINNIQSYRLYLTQKSDQLEGGRDVKVTWLDGLDKKIPPEAWHFDPLYREKTDIDDLVALPVLNETVLLDQLCTRFCKGRIYTYVGGILIAINPFKYFPIYNPKYVNAYQNKKLGELPPHVFAIADAAYNRMLISKQNQCIVISGESGSGKTESTKLILHHLTALSHKTKATVLEKTILAAGPVLEAFGNAKTSYNNNSSRFGKFTQINYRADGVVCGAVLKKYLLEKSRIVQQGINERNYHVFYSMLAGASQTERETLHLLTPQEYFYLNQTQCYTIEGMDEVYEFARLKNSIKNIGIPSVTQQRMFAVLSAVLHIGNITFRKRSFPEDSVSVADEKIIEIIAELIQVDKQELIVPMTMRKTITRGEEFVRQYKKDEAIATRDSMAKCLYASLFDWIVLQTNHIMVSKQGRKVDKKAFSIGVLDIFGFEDFERNSFEQFCINLANENLQFYLNQHIFKIRQDEYVEEGLDWDHVDYADNSTCLNLMVGKPTGLILLLDEECSLTIGTDESLLDKFNQHHSNNTCYEMPPTREPVFSILHYAGKVKYQIEGFRAKNRELMRNDVVSVFRNSRMLFVRELMGSDPVAIYYWSILRHTIKAVSIFKKAGAARAKGQRMFEPKASVSWMKSKTPPNKSKALMRQLTEAEIDTTGQAMMRRATKVMNRRVLDMAKRIQSPSRMRSGLEARRTISGGMSEYARRGGLKQPPTVVAQFQSSLMELMDALNQSHPFFVRCIRSNAVKAPLKFEAELVLRQLRYTGMLETVKIRQAGYPVRIFVKQFVNQFRILLRAKDLDRISEDELTQMLTDLGLDTDEFQVGANKVFMRESQYQLLRDKMQQAVDRAATTIQVWYHRRYLRKLKELEISSAIIIQKYWRGFVCRREYVYYQETRLRNRSARRIQNFWRTHEQTAARKPNKFNRFKRNVIKLQSIWRGYKCRNDYPKLLAERKEAEETKAISEKSDKSDETQHLTKEPIQQPPLPPSQRRDPPDLPPGLPFDSTHALEGGVVDPPTVTITCAVGSPYSPHRKTITEKADNMMGDLLKDTMFSDSQKEPSTDDELESVKNVGVKLKENKAPVEVPSKPPSQPPVQPPEVKTGRSDGHLYEEIGNFESVFKTSDIEAPPEEKKANLVKLRHKDSNDESRRQKFYRRLSFTHKDKSKSSIHLRKSREAEDFEMITAPTSSELLQPVNVVKNTTTGITTPASHSSGHHHGSSNTPKATGLAGLFTLTRKGSRRDTPKDKRSHRRSLTTAENDYVANGEVELEALNGFLMKKVADMNKPDPEKKNDSGADVTFKHALHKYHGNLLFTCANASVNRKEEILLKFNDLVHGFQETLEQIINQADSGVSKEFSVMGVNLFRGILEEFQKNKDKLVVKTRSNIKHVKKKRRKTAEFYEHKGHVYTFQNFNIRTYCEYCNSYIYDKGLVCQACAFTCHKKCHSKYPKTCKGRRPSLCGPSTLFGTPMSELTSPNNPIPETVIKLMIEIEKRGLYTLGIYRKPGPQAAINNLKSVLTSTEAEELILEDEKPHTLASILKLFFRQLPQPIIPFNYYDDFIRSTDLENKKEIHSTLYELIQHLPKENKLLLERLIVHLGRVTSLVEHNKMSPNALAIVWAPCLLRASEDADPLESLAQLPKQTKCVEILIEFQVKSRKDMLNDIQALYRAESTAGEKLDDIIQSEETDGDPEKNKENDEMKEILKAQIQNMSTERERITNNMAAISPPKTRSLDSVDDLTDMDYHLRDSFEVLHFPEDGDHISVTRQSSVMDISNETPSTPTSTEKRHVDGNSSSFEDLSCVGTSK